MTGRSAHGMFQSATKPGNDVSELNVGDPRELSPDLNNSKHNLPSGCAEKSLNYCKTDKEGHSRSLCSYHSADADTASKFIQPKKSASNNIRHSPNEYLWQKLESLIDQMVSEDGGIPVRNVKSLMSTIPSTFTGSDIVNWLMQHTGASDVTEAVHLASRIASMGYIFCIDDHVLTVKNDSHSHYRFQTPFLYPSRCMEADTADYAVYLCKRTMQNKQRLELAGFEAERLASLQNIYCHKWEFIYIQAEAEAKVDKKQDKFERLVLESQERAYWDLHRPPPGCINTTDVDMRKLCRAKRPKKTTSRPVTFPIPSGPDGSLIFAVLDNLPLNDKITKLQSCSRTRIKASKAAECLQNFADQYSEFDLLLSTSISTGIGLSNNSTNGVVCQSGVTSSTGHLSSSPGPNFSASSVSCANTTTISTASTSHPTSCFPISSTISRGSSDKLSQHNRSTSATGFSGILSLSAGQSARMVPPNGQHSTPNASGSLGHLIGSTTAASSGFDQSQESVSALNPWISDNPDYWLSDVRLRCLPIRRIKRWSFSIHELLKDPVGLEEFQRWLEKEFSAENLRFWQACQELKGAPLKEVRQRIMSIYNQYLAANAVEPLNVDSRVSEAVRRHLEESSDSTPNRYCFEEAEEHIFHLMKSDSYCRFLRSDVYRELFRCGKKKSKKQRSTVGAPTTLISGLE